MAEVLERKPKTAKPVILTLGGLIDKAYDLREEKRKAEAEVKRIEALIEENDTPLFAALDAQEVDASRGKKASVSIGSATVCTVQDWSQVWPHIAKHKLWHLPFKRISDPGYRELLELGKTLPGATPFTKRKLSLRSLIA